MHKIYGISIIGCGYMGEHHVSDIYNDSDFTMVTACDINKGKAAKFGKLYGFMQSTDNEEECILNSATDIVIIATYPSSHVRLIRKSFEAGKHVLCEKPICSDKEELNLLLDLVDKYPDCKIMFGLILRHNESYNMIADMIHKGKIGFPVIMRMTQGRHAFNWDRYRRLICETSPIVDCGIHYLDVMQWFTEAKIISIDAICQRTEDDLPYNSYNYGMITVTLDDGSTGYYEIGWGSSIVSENKKEFIGPLGRISLVSNNSYEDQTNEKEFIELYENSEHITRRIPVNAKSKPTGAQLKYLVGIINNSLQPLPDINDIVETSKLLFDVDEKLKMQLASRELKSKHFINM